MSIKGLEEIVKKYSNVYTDENGKKLSESEIYTHINDYGIRFSRTLATEASGKAWYAGYAGCYVDANVGMNMDTGARAIYALQYGSGFSSYNTGFEDHGGYGLSNANWDTAYMDKSKFAPVGNAVLNNFDNIIRIPTPQVEAKLYVQYNRKSINTNAQNPGDVKIIRTPEWQGKGYTEVEVVSTKESAEDYPEGETKIQWKEPDQTNNNELLTFDEMYLLKDYQYNVTISPSAKYEVEVEGEKKILEYELDKESCRYVLHTSFTAASMLINDSNKKVLWNEDASTFTTEKLKTGLYLTLKLVYKPKESENKILVQYKVKDIDSATGKLGSAYVKQEFSGLGLTSVLDTFYSEIITSTIPDEGTSIVQDQFKVAMSRYQIEFMTEVKYGKKKYKLALSQCRYLVNDSEVDITTMMNKANKRITKNPFEYMFKEFENMGIVLVYEEVPEEQTTENAKYITLDKFDLKGTLQFINVTNTSDEKNDKGIFTISDTYAGGISKDNNIITAAKTNNSIDGISVSVLLKKLKFFRSTYTEGTTNEISVEPTYDFVPSGEYISPYLTDAYSYIVRGITWKVNEDTYDIQKHRITVRRSYMYVVRWANDGMMPGFSHSQVPNSWFKFKYAEGEADYVRKFTTRDAKEGSLTAKNIFIKYWEVKDGVCPYRKGARSAEGDHYHNSGCCPGMVWSNFRESDKEFSVTIKDDDIKGHKRKITKITYTAQAETKLNEETGEYEPTGKYYWPSQGTDGSYYQYKYNTDSGWPSVPTSQSQPTAAAGASYTTYSIGSPEEIPCDGSYTFYYTKNEVSNISINTVFHTTGQVQNGLCNQDPQDGGDVWRYFSVSGTGTTVTKECSESAKCGHTLGGTESGSGYGYAKHDKGIVCNWSEYYSREEYIDGAKGIFNNEKTKLYTGHYHHLDCFISFYDFKEISLESTSEWGESYKQKYLDKVKPCEDGHLPTAKESGIDDTDTYMYGMDEETEELFKNSGIIGGSVKYNLGEKISYRDYEGTYTLKYYTIENFMLYRIKDLTIYDSDKYDENVGTDVFDGDEIVVSTSDNYNNLFVPESNNGLYSNAHNYNRNFLRVDWGVNDLTKPNNLLNLDEPQKEKTYESKLYKVRTSEQYLALATTAYPEPDDPEPEPDPDPEPVPPSPEPLPNPYLDPVPGDIAENEEGKDYTFAQIKVRPGTYYIGGGKEIYPYVGADGTDAKYADSMKQYREFEDSYVFLADKVGILSGQNFEILAAKSVYNITDTEVALRIGVRYTISDFYNDYFRFQKDYGENIDYLSHHTNYMYSEPTDNQSNTENLFNKNQNWVKQTIYEYTWKDGMTLTGKNIKSTETLMYDKSFLSQQARDDKYEIHPCNVDVEENELKKLFDATNFTNTDAKKYANGNKFMGNSEGEVVRGIKGTYLTGEGAKNASSSSYIYTKNYIKYTDNDQNKKLTDIYDWTLMNLPVSVLYKNDGVGNGKRSFTFKLQYELVTDGRLHKNSDDIDCYTNYTDNGVTHWEKPDYSSYYWTQERLEATDYTWTDDELKLITKSWSAPDPTKKHIKEVSVHIEDKEFIGDGLNQKVVQSKNLTDQDAYLNILSPVSIKDFNITTSDMIEHITTTNSLAHVLGKNTKFELTWTIDTSEAGVGYGEDADLDDKADEVYTEKYTKEYWIQCDFDLYCDRCQDQDHEHGGYHPAYDVIRVQGSDETRNDVPMKVFKARTTGTYSDPAVGTGENMVKILAIANNTPDELADYVEKNDLGNGQYVYEDKNKNTFKNRQTGIMNQTKGINRTPLYTATMDDAYHIAYKEFKSDSIFRIFGFEITDFKDISYKDVFKTGIESTGKYYTGRYEWDYEIYAAGKEYVDHSNAMDDRWSFEDTYKFLTLPVGPYSNTNSGYVYAPKLGYTFSFNLKTTGYLANANKDNTRKIYIQPSYYYISKDGKTYEEAVDLYYKDANGVYTKFQESTYKLGIKPNDGYRNLRFIDDTDYSVNVLSSELLYMDISKEFVLDNKYMTTSYTNFIQTWYGDFKLPNSTIAVPKGSKKLNNPLTDGYIGVKFEITCYDERSNQTAYYSANEKDTDKWGAVIDGTSKENTSQWDYEGNFGLDKNTYVGKGEEDFGTFTYKLEKGDWIIYYDTWQQIKSTVVLYDTDLRAEDDFQ